MDRGSHKCAHECAEPPNFCGKPAESLDWQNHNLARAPARLAAPLQISSANLAAPCIGDTPANKLRTLLPTNVRQLRNTGGVHNTQCLVKSEVYRATEDVNSVHHMGQLKARHTVFA